MSFRLGDFKQKTDPTVLKREKGERRDGRAPGDLRPAGFTTGYLKHADGSCLVELGDTRVVCAVSVEEKVPPFLKGKGEGWVTAEYGMLPRATHTRSPREVSKGAPSGRIGCRPRRSGNTAAGRARALPFLRVINHPHQKPPMLGG